jgi:isopenicillin-N epimerase
VFGGGPSDDKITQVKFTLIQRFTMLKEFFLLDPEIVFLNHGSFGACPRPVFEIYQAWQRRLELQPVQFLGVDLENYLYQTRQILGGYINSSANDIVYIPNATHGVNIIARSLQLKPGDEILTTNQEYGACNFAWEHVCNKTGAIYKRQPITIPFESAEQIMDQLWQGVTPKTKIIFTSHITSPTSLTIPVQMICQRARQAKILTLIDGAHAPGQIPLDLASIQADFYVGNCHKWMLSPKGAGFIYSRPEVQNLIEPLVVSWGYQSKYTTPRESTFVDYLQWTGTKDPASVLSVPAAITFMEENHWNEVRESCHHILRKAMETIGELTGLQQLYPLDSDFYHQMGTIPIPHVKDLVEFKSRLLTEYKIEIPYIEWENHQYLRLSVQGYNTLDDINQLVHALSELLPIMVEE